MVRTGGDVIAIDGPAGSGKSTTARQVAHKLKFVFLDTGAMYRAVTLLALEKKVGLDNAKALEKLAAEIKIEFRDTDSGQEVWANGRNVTTLIRSAEVTTAVSPVSAHAGVRKYLVALQQEIGRNKNVVAEGRDTTSVVFPDALLKVYLVASVEERARRRVLDFKRMGKQTTLEEQIEALEKRDRYDSGREVSPLTQMPNAVLLDTTNLTIEQQVEKIIELYRRRVEV